MLAFVHVAKTGGKTISWMLRGSFGVRHCDILPWQGVNGVDPIWADGLRRAQRLHIPLKSIAGHSVMLYADLEQVDPGLQHFAFVREPLARAASMYQFRVLNSEPDLTFDEWLGRQIHHNHQTKMMAGSTSVDDAIRIIRKKRAFVGLTERFDESLVLFRQLLAPELDIAYERRNASRNQAVAKELLSSSGVREALSRVYESDLALYDYIANELYPTYCREYGGRLTEDVAEYRQNRGQLNRRNVFLNRVYRNLVYKPALHLHRWRSRREHSEERG